MSHGIPALTVGGWIRNKRQGNLGHDKAENDKFNNSKVKQVKGEVAVFGLNVEDVKATLGLLSCNIPRVYSAPTKVGD